MAAPAVGDLVLYEGARWHVVAEGISSVQRFGSEFRPVGEPYLVLRPELDAEGGAEEGDVKVPKSRWQRIEVVAD
jgi:hypothetical protein